LTKFSDGSIFHILFFPPDKTVAGQQNPLAHTSDSHVLKGDRMKVLISDNLSPLGEQILRDAGLEVDIKTGLPPEELKKIISGYDGLVIRSATKVTADIISAATNLKVIGRAGIGLDNVDIPSASQKGIIVMNAPDGNATTAAEHALAMMMSLTRNIPQATASMKAGKWEKKKFMGR